MNISLESCAAAIAQNSVDKMYMPLLVAVVLFIVFLFAALICSIELAKRKRFMVKNGLEQKYEEWLHDRKIE